MGLFMDVKEALKRYIYNWMNSGSSGSSQRCLKMLSRHSGVNYQTVRRIASGESTPEVDNMIAIAEIVCDDQQQVINLVKKANPRLGKVLESLRANEHEKIKENTLTSLIGRDLFRVFCLAGRHAGTTQDEVQQLFGEPGLIALDDLIENSIVENRNNRIYLIKEDPFIIGDKLLKTHLTYLLELYDHRKEKPHSTIFYGLEGLNEEAVRELTDEIRRLERKIVSYFEDPLKKGPITWYTGIFSNTLGGNNE